MTDILVFLLFLLWGIRQKKTFFSEIVKQSPAFLFFIFFLVVSILLSGRILGGLYSLLKFLEFSFLAYYIATTISKKNQLEKVILLFASGIIFESTLAFFQYLTQGSIGGPLYFLGERFFTAQTPGIANASINGQLVLRAYGTFSHPNVLAGYLVIGMVLLLLFPFTNRQRNYQNILVKLALLLGTGALFLTMSRIAISIWLSILIAFFLRFFLQRTKQRTKRIFLIFVSLGVFFMVGVFFLSQVGFRFIQTNLFEEAVIQRETLITASFKMLLVKPLLGVGLGNFLPTLAVFEKPLSQTLYLQPVHNIFLLVAVETGFIGLMFFLWFVFKTYRHIRNPAFVVILSAVLVLGFFDHYLLTLQQGQLLFACILGLCRSKMEGREVLPRKRSLKSKKR